jgi:uncharacterized delta-60 repeat protein
MKNVLLTWFTLALSVCSAFAQPGIPDNSFGTGAGINRIAVDKSSNGVTVHVLPSNELIISGWSSKTSRPEDHIVFKCSKDGLLDNIFGIKRLNAGVMWNLRYTTMNARISPSGKIVASNSSIHGVYRFLADGSEDASFGINGYAEISQSTDWYLLDILVQPDEKVLIMGIKKNGPRFLARLNADGSLDGSFNNGSSFSTFTDDVYLSLKPDGKILIHWYDNIMGQKLVTKQFLPDGQPDNSFGYNSEATAVLPYNPTYDINTFKLLSNGKILVAGSHANPKETQVMLFDVWFARLNSDGSLDNSFGNGGVTKVERLGLNDFINNIAIQPDGKILAAGYTEDNATGIAKCMLIRFTENGALDNGFGSNAIITTTVGNNFDGISDIALQSDGRIVATGYTETKPPLTYGEKEITLIRYHGDVSAGTNTIENQSAFTLYPNPAQDHITLQLADDKPASYRLINTYGQTLMQGTAISAQAISISGLSPGIYFISATTADGRIHTQRFLKQ